MTNARHKAIVVSALLVSAALPASGRADEMPSGIPSRVSVAGVTAAKGLSAVGVTLDFAKVLSFGEPARTIIIGNPGIVDGTLSDEYTIVLTGKALGTTNMIVLGETGQEIANLTVNVGANTRQWMTVHQGKTQEVFSCTGPCRLLATSAQPHAAPAQTK